MVASNVAVAVGVTALSATAAWSVYSDYAAQQTARRAQDERLNRLKKFRAGQRTALSSIGGVLGEAMEAAFWQRVRAQETARLAAAFSLPVLTLVFTQDNLVDALQVLRARLVAAEESRPFPLLHIPLLGSHESVDCVVLAAVQLWGCPRAHAVLLEPLLEAEETGEPLYSSLFDAELTRFGLSLSSLSKDSVELLLVWLRDEATAPHTPSFWGSTHLPDDFLAVLFRTCSREATCFVLNQGLPQGLDVAFLATLGLYVASADTLEFAISDDVTADLVDNTAAIRGTVISTDVHFRTAWQYCRGKKGDLMKVPARMGDKQVLYGHSKFTEYRPADFCGGVFLANFELTRERGFLMSGQAQRNGRLSFNNPLSTSILFTMGKCRLPASAAANKTWVQSRQHGEPPQIAYDGPDEHALLARALLWARVFHCTRARVLLARLSGGAALIGASLQHCQALAASADLYAPPGSCSQDDDAIVFDSVAYLHTKDSLWYLENQTQIATLLSASLQSKLRAPPAACEADAHAVLRAEVTPFVADFVELLGALYVATPLNAAGQTPLHQALQQKSSIGSEAAKAVGLVDFAPPVEQMQLRMRREEAARRAAADAAARLPRAAEVAGTILAVAIFALLSAAMHTSLLACVSRLGSVATLRAVRMLLLLAAPVGAVHGMRALARAAFRSPTSGASLHAFQRAAYLAYCRYVAQTRAPLLRDARALERRCASQLRAWLTRQLAADLRAACARRSICGAEAQRLMLTAAAAAEPAELGGADGLGAGWSALPASCAETMKHFDAFLDMPCDEDAQDGGGGAADARSWFEQALRPPSPQALLTLGGDSAAEGDDRSARKAAAKAAKPRRTEADPAAGVSREGLSPEEEEAEEAEEPEPKEPKKKGSLRTAREHLATHGWRFQRAGRHFVFKRTVVMADGGEQRTQNFILPCTPGDVRAGRNATAQLRRLDHGVASVVT